jgi:hypothetical protein
MNVEEPSAVATGEVARNAGQSTGGLGGDWPPLEYAAWRDTVATLHLWTQIVGKVRLALSPWLNHGWHVTLYVNARGLGTSPIHAGRQVFEVDFDFIDQRLAIRTQDGFDRGFALEPMSVASFYHRFMAELAASGIDVTIKTLPNEVPEPIRFPEDELHRSYDAAAARTFWEVLVRVDRAFRLFRSGFLGKASPVHFFWGSFDLAVTRFSGRGAPLHPGAVPGLPDPVTREAYSHEVSSAGFWPGNDAYPQAAFYSYAYPMPRGFELADIEPHEAIWAEEMGEWLLPYDAVRLAPDPEAALMAFLQTTYRAAARLGSWPERLECELGAPGIPRPL